MTTATTDAPLQQRIEELRAERGDTIAITEVAEVVQSLMQTMAGDLSSLDIKMYKELDDLASYVRAAKQEISEIHPHDLRSNHIPEATDELDAIVAATEEATGNILDSAEVLEALALKVDEDSAKQITEVVTKIYESCNFLDVTGQRISKVVNTFKHIDEHLDKLVAFFGGEIKKTGAAIQKKNSEEKSDHDLLNGPQLADQAATQAEIDALLASFD